jgi:hypothetical protein
MLAVLRNGYGKVDAWLVLLLLLLLFENGKKGIDDERDVAELME